MLQSRPKPLQELERRLKSGDFGNTPKTIISVCKQIAELDEQISHKEKTYFLEKCHLNKKKWKQLTCIGRDQRLDRYLSDLPSSVTSLYALTTLTNNELNDGMVTGELHQNISSRDIYAYARECRLRSRAFSDTATILPCYIALSSESNDPKSIDLESLLREANKMLTNSGVMILLSVSSTSKFDNKQKELINREKRQCAIETEIEHQMYIASEDLSRRYSIEQIDEIMEGSMSKFVNALSVISRSRMYMMQTYGTMYCYKIALEYHRSRSRVQRYNYKRRLIHVQQKYKHLSPVVDKIFDDLIERPKKMG